MTEKPMKQTPAEFAASLADFASRQRLDAWLAEVRLHEAHALADLTESIQTLNQAIALRERLEFALKRAADPLSATQSAERAQPRGPATPGALGPDLGVFRNPEVYAYPLAEVIKVRLSSGAPRNGLSKPGPY